MISVKDSLRYFFHSFFPIFNRNVLTPKDWKLSSDTAGWSWKPSSLIYMDGSKLIMCLYPLYARSRLKIGHTHLGFVCFLYGNGLSAFLNLRIFQVQLKNCRKSSYNFWLPPNLITSSLEKRSVKKIIKKRKYIYLLYVFIEKNPCGSGPVQFKPVLFKGQLYM